MRARFPMHRELLCSFETWQALQRIADVLNEQDLDLPPAARRAVATALKLHLSRFRGHGQWEEARA
jgi:hypothetical protein